MSELVTVSWEHPRPPRSQPRRTYAHAAVRRSSRTLCGMSLPGGHAVEDFTRFVEQDLKGAACLRCLRSAQKWRIAS